MSYGPALLALLGPLVDARCWPDYFPQLDAPTWPAIRVTHIGGAITLDACGSGDPETDDVDVQIDVVTIDAAARDALVSAVRTAVQTSALPAVLNAAPVHTWDPETRTHRGILLFTLYGSSS